MIFFSPINLPNSAAPRTPLVGPDSIIVKGIIFVASKVSIPPLDCMTYGLPEKFDSFNFVLSLSR